MHPEVKGKKGDKCPKCGMDLVAVKENSDQYTVALTTSPKAIQAGEPAQLAFTFKESDRKVSLEISHEMKVHLMTISEDLTWFRHIHPEEQKDGSYTITETFPYSGRYLIFTDFKPADAAPIVNKKIIEVKGNTNNNKADNSEKFISEVDGYKVTLENGNDFKSNRTQSLKISIKQNGKALTENDIQQYLGANAHIVMIGRSDKEYLHIHPVTDKRFPVYAETHIEKPGIYRIWVQFKSDEKVHTADFTVNVKGEHNDNSERKHVH
jgi:hypothetical protein